MGNEKKNFKGKKNTGGSKKCIDRKKSSKKFSPKEKDFSKDEPVWKDGPNDPIWRCSDKTMTALVANLPFGLAAGLPQTVTVGSNSMVFAQPGVFTIHTLLTMGEATDYNSAINLCSRKVYSYVRHANSGSKNYEAADLTIYFAAIMQALGLLGWLQRLLTVLDKYSVTNRYKPQIIVESMGVNYSDILSHQPQLKWLVAWLGRAVGSLAFPQLPIFTAAYEAFKYIIIDKTSPKPQLYMYNPYGFGEFSPTGESTGSSLYYNSVDTHSDGHGWITPDASGLMTFDNLDTFAHHLMNVLLSDEDCGIMSGDILKAFANSGLFTPQAFGEYDPFVESPELLQQIHNLNILPVKAGRLIKYVQNPGSVNLAPYVTHSFAMNDTLSTGYSSKSHCNKDLIIDAFSDDPQPEEVVNCTVMQINYDFKELQNSGAQKMNYVDPDTISFDLYLPCYVTMGIFDDGKMKVVPASFINRCEVNPTISAYNLQYLNFDWAPMLVGTTSQGKQLYVLGDIQNFRIWTGDVSRRIHENSILSLLNFKELNFVK